MTASADSSSQPDRNSAARMRTQRPSALASCGVIPLAMRPLAADRTLTEIWHFRLKGAPEAIYRRSLAYYQLVNTPSTMINADDLDNFWRCHEGLKTNGGDWVSFHRNAGQDPTENGVTRSITGMSELPMRHMFTAWTKYMNGGSAR